MKDPIAKIKKEIIAHPSNKEMGKLGYVPIFTASASSRVALIGQAPGIRAQESRKPWNDKSGELLRVWLGITDEEFYDEKKIALLPMDFYFPGKGKSGDLPPREEQAKLWHPKLEALMPNIKFRILIGQYSQGRYLKDTKKDTLTETVRNYKQYLREGFFPIPHPSPRNRIWLKKNEWFEQDVIPQLQKQIRKALKT